MEAIGVCFERVRVDPTPGSNAAGGWAYRMSPAVDALGMYETLEGAEKEGVRFAVRQVLDQELKKLELVREKEARERRMGEVLAKEVVTMPVVEDKKGKKRKVGKVKRDFFGRLVVEVEGDEEEEKKKRRKKVVERDDSEEVYVKFHEGFSNAVRKGIGLEELMAGFF
jgi:chromosome transmission fidelity protein 18